MTTSDLAPKANTAPEVDADRRCARARRADSVFSTTTESNASPSAASTEASQPSSITTRSSNVPTTPATSFNFSAPARARALSSANCKASLRACQRASSDATALRVDCALSSSASADNRRASASVTSLTRGTSTVCARSHSLRRRSISVVYRPLRSDNVCIRADKRRYSESADSTDARSVRNSPRTSAAALAADVVDEM